MPVTGTPNADPITPGSASCAGQSVVRPNTSTIFGCDINGRRKAIRLAQDQDAVIEWGLTDGNGNPIDLASCGSFEDGDEDTGVVKLTVAESVSLCQSLLS